MFSSRNNEVSYAGEEFSGFTESILTSLLDMKGEVRYREIMDAVADDFDRLDGPKPIFVTQSSNMEKFGFVSEDTHQLIYKAFGINPDVKKRSDETSSQSSQTASEEKLAPRLSIFDQVVDKSKKVCFNEKLLSSFISDFYSNIKCCWDVEIEKAYSINTDSSISYHNVPNSKKLGEWLESNKEKNYFASAEFDTEQYQVEEYKTIPKHPSKLSASDSWAFLSGLNDKIKNEYRLETVTKTRRFISGFRYTHQMEEQILKVSFEPKLEIVDPICLYVVPFYSNKELVINFSYEFLSRYSWQSYYDPLCNKWRTIKVNINGQDAANSTAQYIKKEVEVWLIDTISKFVE